MIAQIAPGAPLIDLSHGVARQDIRQGAILLADALPFLPSAARTASSTRCTEHLREVRRAERGGQKTIRAAMRRCASYIIDYDRDAQGFTVSDLDDLVRRGVITVRDDS